MGKICALLVLTIVFLVGCTGDVIEREEADIIAVSFLDSFINGDLIATSALLNNAMASALSPRDFTAIRDSIFAEAGEFLEYEITNVQEIDRHLVYAFTARHSFGKVLYSISVDSNGQIGGFFYTLELPAPATIEADAEIADIAAVFIDRFLGGDMSAAFEMTTELMQSVMSELSLEDIRASFTEQGGEVLGHDITAVHYVGDGAFTYDFTVRQSTGSLILRVSVDAEGKVQGFFNLGFELDVELPPGVSEIEITVNSGTALELPGRLTFPADAGGPIPAVILVHGSGATNMDLSLFSNRPFRDIAYGLAERGIAVLRYDKRAYVHPHPLTTVSEETIDDAVAAKAALLEQGAGIGLEFSGIYVAGLSLGGMLAPRIAEEGGFDGAILLAGSPRSLIEIIYDQNMQIIDDALRTEQMTQEEADNHRENIAVQLELRFGLPAAYHQSIVDSLPLPFIARNQTPVLILHGDRDFQVFTDRDFQMFVDYTQDMAHVQTILYDNLNHLFMQSQTEYNDSRDYMIAGHVDEAVIYDMAQWIIRHSR